MTKFTASYFRQQIEEFFEDRELHVLCQRRNHAYSVIHRDNGARIARLRPTGRGDEVEVYAWNGDCWQPISGPGKVRPLQEALKYITDDPECLFFESDRCRIQAHSYSVFRLGQLMGLLHKRILVRALFSSSVAGLGRSPTESLLIGIVAALVFCPSFEGLQHGWRVFLASFVLPGIPILFVTAPAAILGGSLHQLLGSGVWPMLAGALAAGISSLVMLTRRRLCWLLSFAAAFLLAATCRDRIDDNAGYVGWFIVALCAATIANLYGRLAEFYRAGIDSLTPSQNVEQDKELIASGRD